MVPAMTRVLHQILRLNRILALFLAALACQWISPWMAMGFQQELQVGDIVEFDFMRETRQGEIVDINGNGWPSVKFEYRGRMVERIRPPRDVTVIEVEEEPSSGNSKLRIWTDASGKFTISAKLLSNKNGKVELEKEDGRVITLPANKLSEPDLAYLKEVEAESDEENPFAGGEMKSKPANRRLANRRTGDRRRNNTPAEPAGPPAITPVATSNEIILSDSEWNVEPDSAESVESGNRVIGFTSSFTKHAFHNRLSNVAYSPDKKFLATSLTNPFEKASEIVVVDLANSKARSPIQIPGKDCQLLAISPSGTKAVTFRKGQGREKGAVDFWKLGESADNVARWNAASFFDRDEFLPTTAYFLDESRLLTFGRRVILWDCETAAALYSFSIPSTSKPVLSPNGKQIAIGMGNAIYLVETETGKTLGKIETEKSISILAFSQDGIFLAGLRPATGGIDIWDLGTGELIQQMAVPGGSGSSLVWAGEKHLLVNGTELMDVELRATVWRYKSKSGGSIISTQDGRYWYVGKTKIVPVSFAKNGLDAKTANLDPDSLLVLKPGAELTIEFDMPIPPNEQKQIRDRMVSNLQANGISIGSGSDLRIVASIKKGKQESAEMSDFRDPLGRFGTQKITYTPNYAKVEILVNGKSVWRKSRRFGPGGMIHMNQNESAQQAANRLCQPDAGFFKGIEFPKFFAQLPGGKPLGESVITEQGIQ